MGVIEGRLEIGIKQEGGADEILETLREFVGGRRRGRAGGRRGGLMKVVGRWMVSRGWDGWWREESGEEGLEEGG